MDGVALLRPEEQVFTATYPWNWTPAMVDEWLGDLRSLRDLKRSTIRSYSEAVRSFCHFVSDPLYEWTATCEDRFGTHPVQVVHEWNTAVHVQDNESDPKKRAFTEAELHAFFAHCDDEVARIRSLGRKGWLPAFRNATVFKTAYAYGTRRNASTTSIYTCVSSDFRTRTLRRHLDDTVAAALQTRSGRNV
ncbi:hypothetical protein ACOBQB_10440 [Streptomyces sp. G5(2025)]|uniref:hypothetical protein n=1 Tax=Streptomyces sp. G5(2025) TaxID=3406628 RepID=UPI003C242448